MTIVVIIIMIISPACINLLKLDNKNTKRSYEYPQSQQ